MVGPLDVDVDLLTEVSLGWLEAEGLVIFQQPGGKKVVSDERHKTQKLMSILLC